MSKNKKNKKFNKNMNPTEKNQPQDEEVLKNQEAAEAAIDEETQKEATEELSAEEKVNKELAEAQKTIEEQHDKYLRLSAEFDNYRKRTMKEKAELIKNGGETGGMKNRERSADICISKIRCVMLSWLL